METYRFNFESSRELFEAASDAVRDAEACRRQLDALEEGALSVGSPSLDARVSGGDHDRIGRTVANLVDREKELDARMEQDYALIDAATCVLYGRDQMSDGLACLMPPWVADAIWQHFLALHTWDYVSELMGYCKSQVIRTVRAAFEVMDAHGMAATVEGRGIAED